MPVTTKGRDSPVRKCCKTAYHNKAGMAHIMAWRYSSPRVMTIGSWLVRASASIRNQATSMPGGASAVATHSSPLTKSALDASGLV